MTFTQMEEFVDDCIKDNLPEKQLIKLAKSLPFFDSCNFVVIYEKKTNIKIPV